LDPGVTQITALEEPPLKLDLQDSQDINVEKSWVENPLARRYCLGWKKVGLDFLYI